jgi:hypothetical protein
LDLLKGKTELIKSGVHSKRKKRELKLIKDKLKKQGLEYTSFLRMYRSESWAKFLGPDPIGANKATGTYEASRLLYLLESLLDFEEEKGIRVNREAKLAWLYKWLRKVKLVKSKSEKKLSDSSAYDMAKAHITEFKNTAPIERLYSIHHYGPRYAALAMSGKSFPSHPVEAKSPDSGELKKFAKSIGRLYPDQPALVYALVPRYHRK